MVQLSRVQGHPGGGAAHRRGHAAQCLPHRGGLHGGACHAGLLSAEAGVRREAELRGGGVTGKRLYAPASGKHPLRGTHSAAMPVPSAATSKDTVLQKTGGTRLAQIDPRTLDPEVRRKRRITANNTFTDFRSALNMAFGDGKIASNAAWRYVKIFRRVDRARTDILTWEQAKRLVDLATPEFRRLILAALYTGCRLSELFQDAGRRHRTHACGNLRPAGQMLPGPDHCAPDEGYLFFKTLAGGRSTDSPLIRRKQDWPWTTSYVAVHFKAMAQKIGLARQLRVPLPSSHLCLAASAREHAADRRRPAAGAQEHGNNDPHVCSCDG